MFYCTYNINLALLHEKRKCNLDYIFLLFGTNNTDYMNSRKILDLILQLKTAMTDFIKNRKIILS